MAVLDAGGTPSDSRLCLGQRSKQMLEAPELVPSPLLRLRLHPAGHLADRSAHQLLSELVSRFKIDLQLAHLASVSSVEACSANLSSSSPFLTAAIACSNTV